VRMYREEETKINNYSKFTENFWWTALSLAVKVMCVLCARLTFHRKRQDVFYWVQSAAYRGEDSGNVLGKIHAELGQ
jgi:hypothetical protein